MRIVTNMNTPAAKRNKELNDMTANLTAELARFTIPELKPSVPTTAHKAAAPRQQQQQSSIETPAPPRETAPPATGNPAEDTKASAVAVPAAAVGPSGGPDLRQPRESGGAAEWAPRRAAPPLSPPLPPAPREGGAAPAEAAQKDCCPPDMDDGWDLRRREVPGPPDADALDGGGASGAGDGGGEPARAASGGSGGRSGRQRHKIRTSDAWASPGYEPKREQPRGEGDDALQVRKGLKGFSYRALNP